MLLTCSNPAIIGEVSEFRCGTWFCYLHVMHVFVCLLRLQHAKTDTLRARVGETLVTVLPLALSRKRVHALVVCVVTVDRQRLKVSRWRRYYVIFPAVFCSFVEGYIVFRRILLEF